MHLDGETVRCIAQIGLGGVGVGVLTTWGGAFLNDYFQKQRERRTHQRQLIEHRLSDFYSPLMILCSEAEHKLEAYNEAHARNTAEGDKAWKEAEGTGYFPHSKHINTNELLNDLEDHLQRMQEVFRQNSHLGSNTVREHFLTFAEFSGELRLQRSAEQMDIFPLEVLEQLPGILEELMRDLEADYNKLTATMQDGR